MVVFPESDFFCSDWLEMLEETQSNVGVETISHSRSFSCQYVRWAVATRGGVRSSAPSSLAVRFCTP